MLLTLFHGANTPFTPANYALLLGSLLLWALPCSLLLAGVLRAFVRLLDRIPGQLAALPGCSLLVCGAVVVACFQGASSPLAGALGLLVPLLLVANLFSIAPGSLLLPPVLLGLGLLVCGVLYAPFAWLTGAGVIGFPAFVVLLGVWWRVLYT
ncbi:hypothetical protein [Hymenobacter sp. BT491]|uniref:hypothetical protein n=1 Tax=Hymenobacter sp. BT491 TaxID=2766779 RepID=UPI0016534B43|nr:hypothetical protein [Hymenobacter sp. BT491]MBC6992236.1 hypothetical protein [Hymenobacter sp. BT491]